MKVKSSPNNRVKSSPSSHLFWKVGGAYLIRTVTYFYTGRLVGITDSELILEEAAWIADTGRFADALKTGKFNEIEPYPGQVLVSRAAIVDACPCVFELPRSQK